MKTLFINNLYTPYDRGGAEKVVEKMLEKELAEGRQAILLTGLRPNDKRPENKFPTYYFNSDYQDLKDYSYIRRWFWHLSDIFSISKYLQIRRLLKKEKPDLIISHNLSGLGLSSFLAIRRSGIEHYHFLHDIQLLHPSGLMIIGQEKNIDSCAALIYQSINRRLLASPKKIISPSRWLLEIHQERAFFPQSETAIQRLEEKINDSEREKDKKRWLFAGQLAKHKGIIFLLEAWKKIDDPNLHLEIAGDGPEMTTAKKIALSDKRINFLGRLKQEDLKKTMDRNGFLVVPSLCYENSPTVIYEARRAGMGILAADNGGIPEIIGPNGHLFSAGNEDCLIKKIRNLSS